MKIVKLQSENIKRLHAVTITPDGPLVTVGGKNGAGKSSVLDSIAYAMGGEKLVPSEPIRAGETEAKIVVDLGDLIVTRKFKREELHDDNCATHPPKDGTDHVNQACDCEKAFGETKSTLIVTNGDGARYPSPQAVLDRLIGRLTFDPLAFARDDAKKQAETLRKLVGLDLSALDAEKVEAFNKRAMLKKTHDIKAAQLLALPFVKDAPAAEISMDEISNELKKAEEHRTLAEEAAREVNKAQNAVLQISARKALTERAIGDLETRLAIERKSLEEIIDAHKQASIEQEAKVITAEAARAVVPDAEQLRVKLKNTEVINNVVRGNKKYIDLQAEIGTILRDVEVQHETIFKAEAKKQAALAAAPFPVPGLGLSDDGVLLHNLPFEQAGSAEQVRVSVAIGIALNPQLKVLLIRNGNLLDKDSLLAVAAQAKEADMQVWMEYVSESKDGVAVMLVDGEVA